VHEVIIEEQSRAKQLCNKDRKSFKKLYNKERESKKIKRLYNSLPAKIT